MAVFTRLDQEDFKAILHNYDIGDFVSSKEISEGVENTNYFLETSNGKYVLTIFEKRVNKRDLPFFLGLMDFLSEHKFPSPEIHRCDESLTFNYKAKTGIITSFLSGTIAEKTDITELTIQKIGEKLANIHNLTKNFEKTRDNEYTLMGITKLFQNLKIKRAIPEEQENLVKERIQLLQSRDFSEMKKGIIHADFFPDNVFLQNDSVTGVIDFYFACHDYLAYDIATAINAWCFDSNNVFQQGYADQLLAGYQKIRRLSTRERYYLKDFCSLTAVRFYLTRLHDKTFQDKGALVTIKDPDEYYKRIEFFNQFNGF